MYNAFSSNLGHVIGDGQCVEVVKLLCGCPQTAPGNGGALVKGATCCPARRFDVRPPSELIPNGIDGNHTDGRVMPQSTWGKTP